MNSSHQQVAALIADKREGFGFIQKEFAEFLGLNAPFKNTNQNSLFNFIDLFAGIGGMRLPFQECGGKCIFTSEWDKFAKKTYATNFGELPAGDITKIKSEDIPQHDLLLAGFPCQAFSQAGLRQGFQDTRGTMFFEIQRILASKKPKAFLLENVKQLKGHDKGRTFQIILDILRGEHTQATPENIKLSLEHKKSLEKNLDYWVDFKILRARDYGVPQNRERIYIVGFDKKTFPDFNFETMFDWSPTKHRQTRLGNILEANCNVDSKYTISDCLWNGHKKRKLNHQKKGNGFGYSLSMKTVLILILSVRDIIKMAVKY